MRISPPNATSDVVVCPIQDDVSASTKVLDAVASLPANVLLLGEPGGANDWAALELHRRSSRAKARFVRVDCAAHPDWDSLLGQVAATAWATRRLREETRESAIVAADGGTLYLSELDETPLPVQRKLLCLLERRETMSTARRSWRNVDVRVIATTRREVRFAMAGNFLMSELYYRLGVPVSVPVFERTESSCRRTASSGRTFDAGPSAPDWRLLSMAESGGAWCQDPGG